MLKIRSLCGLIVCCLVFASCMTNGKPSSVSMERNASGDVSIYSDFPRDFVANQAVRQRFSAELPDFSNRETQVTGKMNAIASMYGLTIEEIIALLDYTVNGSNLINRPLRDVPGAMMTQAIWDRIQLLVSATNKLPKFRGPIYRGTSLPRDVFERYVKSETSGSSYREPAFESTSVRDSAAEAYVFFGGVPADFVPVFYDILDNVSGVDISDFSMFGTSENEVLVPLGALYKVHVTEGWLKGTPIKKISLREVSR